jgi:hypothetical protein
MHGQGELLGAQLAELAGIAEVPEDQTRRRKGGGYQIIIHNFYNYYYPDKYIYQTCARSVLGRLELTKMAFTSLPECQ